MTTDRTMLFCGAAGDLLCPIAEAHGGDVAQIVDGVGDQGHALDEEAENHLEYYDSTVDYHGEKQVLQRRRWFMIVFVVAFLFHSAHGFISLMKSFTL